MRAAGALVSCNRRKIIPPPSRETLEIPVTYTPPETQERLFPGWEITAGGPRPKECGEDRVQMFCDSCGHWFFIPHGCKERTCPHCGVVWSYSKGAEVAMRMIEVGRTPHARGAWGREIIICPPKYQHERLLSDDGYVKTKRRQCIEIAKHLGCRGGSITFHPYRKDGENHHYEVEGPHFHIWGWCDKLKGPDDKRIKRLWKEGWIIKGTVKKDGRAKRYKNWPQWFRKAQYELSHCAIIKGMHAYTNFGICHGHVVRLTSREKAIRKAYHAHPCPKCGGVHLTVIGVEVELLRRSLNRPIAGRHGQTRVRTGERIRLRRRSPV
jgi:predicted RNA-binding Zn-ribbon protein involved in translation (DUF1610 family)